MTEMNRLTHMFLTIAVILSMSSCMKEKREATYTAQEEKIDKYITSNMYKNVGTGTEAKTDTLRVEYNGGASRLITEEGIGEELKADGTVSFYYAGYSFNGSKSYTNLFATNHKETADAAQWSLTDADYELMTVDLADSGLIQGLKDGLLGVKSRESCQILFSGKYGFGKKPFGIIPAESALMFEIWVVAVSNE